MKLRFGMVALVVLMLVAGLTGCRGAKPNENNVIVEYSQALDAFIPDLPASWTYDGIAEYHHLMSLGEVYETTGQKIYRVYGEVEDMSGGESNADFRFDISYVVTGDKLEQLKKGQVLMDSEYDHLTLIQLPLEAGNTWREDVVDSKGKTVGIKATIESVEGDEEKTYTVRYEQLGSDYYELRKIKEGSGVVYFEKVIFYDGDSFPVQYALTDIDREKTLIVKENQNNEGKSPKAYDPYGDATLIELDTIPQSTDTEVLDENLIIELTNLIEDFNGAWTLFANDKNMGILDYVTEDGEAYDIIHRFPAGTMTLSFELIDVGDMRVEGDKANIYVHEIIKKVTEEKTEMLEYFWLYETRRIDGKWYIHSYVNQQ